MQVLVEDQDGLASGEAGKMLEQHLEGQGFLTSRREVGQLETIADRHAEQCRQRGHRLARPLAGALEQSLELGELGRRIVVALEGCGTRQLRGDWVQGAVAVVGRAEVANAGVGLVRQSLAQALEHARLADPGLAQQLDQLALAGLGLLPALHEQGQLLRAPDQR